MLCESDRSDPMSRWFIHPLHKWPRRKWSCTSLTLSTWNFKIPRSAGCHQHFTTFLMNVFRSTSLEAKQNMYNISPWKFWRLPTKHQDFSFLPNRYTKKYQKSATKSDHQIGRFFWPLEGHMRWYQVMGREILWPTTVGMVRLNPENNGINYQPPTSTDEFTGFLVAINSFGWSFFSGFFQVFPVRDVAFRTSFRRVERGAFLVMT